MRRRSWLPLCYLATGFTFWLAFLPDAASPSANPAAGPPFAVTDRSAPRRLALLVGIDDYSVPPGSPVTLAPLRGVRNLTGAVRDVQSMARLLVETQSFVPEDVRVLSDRQATREAILNAIETDLIRRARPGDIALFYYSGHGSQVLNSASSELDKLDESIVPADVRLGARDITDKELRERFLRILDRGALLTVVLDDCHSGSGAREGLLTASVPRGIEPDLRDINDGSPVGPLPEDRGALVLAASQDFQSAWESTDERGRSRGAFSLALERAILERTEGEPASQTFARARARLKAERRIQEPAISGSPEAIDRPLFGFSGGAGKRRPLLAVEKSGADGLVELQGGLALGLTVGSRLRLEGSGTELEVVRLEGFSRCTARIVAFGANRNLNAILPGTLAEVVQWKASPGLPLQVWLAESDGYLKCIEMARTLAARASSRGMGWVTDPTETPPTHVLRWRKGGWELLASAAAPQSLGTAIGADALLDRVGSAGSLFVQLPAPPGYLRRFKLGPGTPNDGVQPVFDPEQADYLLAGRFHDGKIEYAWIRPDGAADRRAKSPLPVRTSWRPAGAPDPDSERDAAENLEANLLQIVKIRAWYQLSGPPGQEFPYDLALRGLKNHLDVAPEGSLLGGERYQFVLRHNSRPTGSIVRRYAYVFTIDSQGDSSLLFPLLGRENHFEPDSQTLREIVLPQTMTISAPFGRDTYFLLTSDEPIPNPGILEFRGFRRRGPPGATCLEELLSQVGGTSRSDPPATTIGWSIDRWSFQSVAPAAPAVQP